MVLIIAEIIIYSMLSLSGKDQLEDERDKLIERISYRNGYWCLCIGVWFLIGHVSLEATNTQMGLSHWLGDSISLLTPAVLANLLLFFFILSEVTVFITQLYHYRKGS